MPSRRAFVTTCLAGPAVLKSAAKRGCCCRSLAHFQRLLRRPRNPVRTPHPVVDPRGCLYPRVLRWPRRFDCHQTAGGTGCAQIEQQRSSGADHSPSRRGVRQLEACGAHSIESHCPAFPHGARRCRTRICKWRDASGGDLGPADRPQRRPTSAEDASYSATGTHANNCGRRAARRQRHPRSNLRTYTDSQHRDEHFRDVCPARWETPLAERTRQPVHVTTIPAYPTT